MPQDTPATLPADFFTKKKSSGEAPATLPKDFFVGKNKPTPKPGVEKLGQGIKEVLRSASGALGQANAKLAPEELPGAYYKFGQGVEKSFGIDPQKMIQAFKGKDVFDYEDKEGVHTKHVSGAEAQWHEMAEEFFDRLHHFGLSVLKDPLNAAQIIEAPATAIEEGGKKILHGQAAEGAGQMFGAFGQLLGGAEGIEKISSHAPIVDGAIKVSSDIAKTTGKDVGEAVTTAHQITQHPVINSILRSRVVEDSYEDTVGIDIAINEFDKAARKAEAKVAQHVEHLSSNIPDKIDASGEADLIKNEFADVVKTPEKYHPILAQMLKDAAPDARNPAPKMWSWDKVRQFRSSVGRSINKTVGPQKVVLTRVYIDLTKKLRDLSVKYGIEDSFDGYTELEKKMHSTFSDLIDEIRGSRKGADVAKALNKDSSYTSRALASLSKYGLNTSRVLDYMKNSSKIQKLRGKSFGTIFRWAYGNPYGAAVTIGTKVLGGSYPVAMGSGALIGISATYLVRLSRALKLAPQIIESFLKSESWPKLGDPSAPRRPIESAGGLPETTGGEPPEAPPEPPSPEKLPSKPGPSGPKKPLIRLSSLEPAKAVTPEGQVVPKAEKVPEGKHGTGKLAEQAKARERVTKIRKEKGPTGAGGGGLEITGGDAAGKALRAKEAALARVSTPHFDVSQFQIPEMEEYLKKKNPAELKELIKTRKLGNVSDEEYKAGLEFLVREDLEK
jgi:hypothetical protein